MHSLLFVLRTHPHNADLTLANYYSSPCGKLVAPWAVNLPTEISQRAMQVGNASNLLFCS